MKYCKRVKRKRNESTMTKTSYHIYFYLNSYVLLSLLKLLFCFVKHEGIRCVYVSDLVALSSGNKRADPKLWLGPERGVAAARHPGTLSRNV